jgi:hypothetical protein
MKNIPASIIVSCKEIRQRVTFAKKIAMALIGLGILTSWTLNAQIATITDNALSFSINGTMTTVGTMTASLLTGNNNFANDNSITATASFNAPFANDGTFHWLQIITAAAPTNVNGTVFGPLKYNGKPLDSSAANNPLPIIDPPNPNYDGKAADDTLPWYLTAAEEGGSTPGLGGNTINGDGSGTFTMKDQPSYGGFQFNTYLVAETGPKTFGVFEDFSWGYGSYGGASSLVPGFMDNYKPVAADITQINTALTDGGFAGWTAQLGYNFVVVPEPSNSALFIVGAFMAIATVRTKRNKAS